MSYIHTYIYIYIYIYICHTYKFTYLLIYILIETDIDKISINTLIHEMINIQIKKRKSKQQTYIILYYNKKV